MSISFQSVNIKPKLSTPTPAVSTTAAETASATPTARAPAASASPTSSPGSTTRPAAASAATVAVAPASLLGQLLIAILELLRIFRRARCLFVQPPRRAFYRWVTCHPSQAQPSLYSYL